MKIKANKLAFQQMFHANAVCVQNHVTWPGFGGRSNRAGNPSSTWSPEG